MTSAKDQGASSRREFIIGSAGAAAGALVLAACGSSSTGGSSATTVAGAAGGITTPAGSTPGTAGAAVPAYARTWPTQIAGQLKDMLVPGSVVWVETPDGVYKQAFGVRTYGGTEPVTLDDHARIGSVTKSMTGTAFLQLKQEGKLSLDDPVSKYRPDVPNGANITLAQVMLMRSGLFNYSELKSFNQTLDDDPGKVYTPEELLTMGTEQPVYFPPGEGYHYSNTNTVLLGLILEQLTGNPFITELQNRVFTKAGLTQTSFPTPTDTQIPAPSPHGYQFGTNLETAASPVLPEDQQAAAKAGTLKPIDNTNANTSWTWAAGQGISTAGDLVTYAKALVDGSLLDPATQAERLASMQPTRPDAPPEAPQYGWQLGQFGPLYGHTGELPGFNTFMGHDPAKKNTVVVWTNLNSSVDGTATAIAVARWIIGQLYTPAASSSTPGTVDAAPGD